MVETVSETVLQDGKKLQAIFAAAEGIINAGELDYRSFASPTVRKAVFLQLELSKPEAVTRYGRDVTEAFRKKTKRFLTDLKDGTLTAESQRMLEKEIKAQFPKLAI